MSDQGHEPVEPLRIVQADADYRRRGRRGDRLDRALITLFVIVTLIFFGGLFVWMFLTGPRHHRGQLGPGAATSLLPSSPRAGFPAKAVNLPVCKPPVVHAATTEEEQLAAKAYCENFIRQYMYNH